MPIKTLMSKRLKCLEHFRVTAAIPISFFQHPIRSFPLPFHQIQVRLKKILMRNRILLVLDDIWNENFIDWDLLLGPLKVGASGSKILVTTRDRNVASLMRPLITYPLLHLSDEDCPIGQIVGPSQIGQENESLPNLSNGEVQLITNFVESLSIGMPEDGSTNWNSPPRFDVTPDESDDADDDADEMVQDNVADLPLEAHVVPDDVADAPQEAHVVEDHVANLPQEAHVVEDHVANLQQECAICVTNARGMAFLCGHTTCVECGERLDRCPICREPISYRIRLFLE